MYQTPCLPKNFRGTHKGYVVVSTFRNKIVLGTVLPLRTAPLFDKFLLLVSSQSPGRTLDGKTYPTTLRTLRTGKRIYKR